MKFKQAHELGWRDLNPGYVIDDPGNSLHYKTGSWRSRLPMWDYSRCIKCGICYIFCPDNAIIQRSDRYFEVDIDYCKGCGICAKECYTQCITMKEERI